MAHESETGQAILLVEDDPDLREVIGYVLTRAGFRVRSAPDGPSALGQASRDPPDLALLDVRLPGMDGFAVGRRLRAARIPVVFLTVRADEESVARGFAAGAQDYIVKPFSPRVLVERIRAILRHHAAPRPSAPPSARRAPAPGGGALDPDRRTARTSCADPSLPPARRRRGCGDRQGSGRP